MRPRKPKNRGLTENLYPTSNGYYQYMNPQTGAYTGMGKDRDLANRAAKRLNEKLQPTDKADQLVRKVLKLNNQKTLGGHLDWMRDSFWPNRRRHGKPLSTRTLTAYARLTARIRNHFGNDRDMDKIDRGHLAAFLEQLSASSRNALRTHLIMVFKTAIAQGCRQNPENPALSTLKADYAVSRQRLTVATYKATYGKAHPVLQRAMTLGLHTLQREEDLVAFKFSSIKDNVLDVIQKKTGAHIKITLLPIVQAVVAECRDNAVSKHLLHYPSTTSRRWRKLIGKPVTTDWIQEQFSIARTAAVAEAPELFVITDENGKKRRMTKWELPTFHEIRSLGKKLYDEAKIDANNLAGWEEGSDMPKLYGSRYEPTWKVATAGLPAIGE